jgi:hypothetical protein
MYVCEKKERSDECEKKKKMKDKSEGKDKKRRI